MGQKSALGTAVSSFRKLQQLTQGALAVRAGVAISTVRTVEHGRGRLATLIGLLNALELELRGRTLMAGPIGAAMASARQKRGQSRREIARALGIRRNTLAALEGGTGLVGMLETYGTAIGAGLYLAPIGEKRAFFSHAGNSTAYHGWETPAALAALLTQAVDGFDLDPCAATTDRRRARIKARLLLTSVDDGLNMTWRGKVFLNPPYGRGLKFWVRKCATAATDATIVVALLPARPDTRWWHDHIAGQADVFMLRGRLQFGAGTRPAPFPSAVIVWGAGQQIIGRLLTALPDAWHIPAATRAR